ncbi:hypothetical protein MLD38_022782 [Melastoma candidum]|uniref:Uncharacterized protein n=1 Tax=Melastoma candidum TaxID=119954 RepID=A0ACB9QPD3_9MYRT|nr:hypothetical protein MLD38_022782 [Melastoma candidum]
MMSPKQISDGRGSPPHFREMPLQVVHLFGNFMRIWSVYSLYRYMMETGASVSLFIFVCLVASSFCFLLIQKPWKGRPLSNTQVVPSIINGAITALYFVLWGKGLKSCGPLRALLAEYSGAALGVLSAVLYGRRQYVLKKVGGLFAMLMAFYLLSQGWSMARYFPFKFGDSPDTNDQTEEAGGIREMLLAIIAGILSALRRVIARRVSLKNQYKGRLHAITISSATCFLFPVAMWDMIMGSSSAANANLPFSTWAFLSTILFGVILIFYVDGIAEERLHMVFSSPRHLMVAGVSILVMEIVYQMDFSLPGFLLCSLILGFGIHQATSLDRQRGGGQNKSGLSNGVLGDEMQISPLPI